MEAPRNYLHQEYIGLRKGKYQSTLWCYVTTLYGGRDLCNDIYKPEVSQFI